MGMGRSGVRFMENGGEWRLPGILDVDDLVLFGDSAGFMVPHGTQAQ